MPKIQLTCTWCGGEFTVKRSGPVEVESRPPYHRECRVAYRQFIKDMDLALARMVNARAGITK